MGIWLKEVTELFNLREGTGVLVQSEKRDKIGKKEFLQYNNVVQQIS